MEYVIAAYAVTLTTFAGYALWLESRRRELIAALACQDDSVNRGSPQAPQRGARSEP